MHPNQRGSFLLILVILVLLIMVGGGSYYLGTQKNTSHPISTNSQQIIVASLSPSSNPNNLTNHDFTGTTACSSEDKLCLLYETITLSVEKKNFNALENYLLANTVPCSKEKTLSVCINVAEGEKKSGYAFGSYQSEWDIESKEMFITNIKNYFATNQLPYYATNSNENTAVLVYLDISSKKFFRFGMKKSDSEWKIVDVLEGVDSFDEYKKMEKSVLDSVYNLQY